MSSLRLEIRLFSRRKVENTVAPPGFNRFTGPEMALTEPEFFVYVSGPLNNQTARIAMKYPQIPVLVLLSAIAVAPAFAQTGNVDTFSFVRIVADASGGSAFVDDAMQMIQMSPGPGMPQNASSGPIRSRSMMILCPPVGGEATAHPAPRQLFNIVMNGTIEIEVSNGEKRQFGPGSMFKLEDTAGTGHITRVVGDEGACYASVTDAR